MTATDPITAELAHERVITASGARSGLSITVAVHSTRLGPALGGCRLWRYDDRMHGLHDALRLSRAMTMKNAAAGIDHGGGKSVIALTGGDELTAERRTAALLDLGDLVEDFGGAYLTAEDVGTTERDMAVVQRQTSHVVGLPAEDGGTGEPAVATALGVYAALRETLATALGDEDPRGRRVTISGLGQVGSRLARRLSDDGARLSVTDLDPRRRELAADLGAEWIDPDEAYTRSADVLVPAGVGGVLTAERIEQLDVRAVVGPANNPLAERAGAKRLHERGILYAPDFIANAGGVILLALAAIGAGAAEVDERIVGIGDTLRRVYRDADLEGTTPLDAAERFALLRLSETSS